ncbi:MAG TPA: hypothetical protein VMG12_00395, partial [Polyangiaceae bacterium]|nr:hypothetical protein [Polyangiaceae bacterium]
MTAIAKAAKPRLVARNATPSLEAPAAGSTAWQLVLAIVTSLVLCALRLDITRHVGFADSEALFVAYRFHPQPAYMDYPGLIGWLARHVEPDPRLVHVATTLAATALPWVGVLAAWASGVARADALRVYFPLALLPALSIGSFAFTPDLPLAYCWLIALGCSLFVQRQPVASFGVLLVSIAGGVAAALACLAKVSGWLLAACLLATSLGRAERGRFRTIAPWAAGGMFAILISPLLTYWWRRGLNIELDPDLSMQHAATILMRPLLSATPPFIVAAVLIGRDLFSPQRQDGVDRTLRLHALLPLLPLAALAACTGAETDWLTPAYLALSLHVARMPSLRRSLAWTCVATGYGVAFLGWCWLRTSLPVTAGQWLGGYDPALDTSNDFYAWGPGKELLEEAVTSARERTGQTPVVVGPSWNVCAQAEVALAGQVHVGCDSLERDDYDLWSDPALWTSAQTLLFITDSRFHRAPPESCYGRTAVAIHRTSVE